MKEQNPLDQLKSAWKSQVEKTSYSQEQIFAMLRNKSISAIKWIYYISLIELIVGLLTLLLPLFYDFNELTNLQKTEYLYVLYSGLGLFYLLASFYIYKFFKAYKNIQIESSVKDMTQQIFSFRKTVKRYIYLSIVFSMLIMPFYTYESIKYIPLKKEEDFYLLFAITLLLSFLLILAFYWVYYTLIYGTFLRRLRRNAKQLNQLD